MSSQKATKSFADKAKTARVSKNFKGLEELGEPQYHSWAAMIKVALEDTNVEASDRTILEEHFQAVKSVSDLVDKVFVAKVKRCFDQRQNKLPACSLPRPQPSPRCSPPWPSRGRRLS